MFIGILLLIYSFIFLFNQYYLTQVIFGNFYDFICEHFLCLLLDWFMYFVCCCIFNLLYIYFQSKLFLYLHRLFLFYQKIIYRRFFYDLYLLFFILDLLICCCLFMYFCWLYFILCLLIYFLFIFNLNYLFSPRWFLENFYLIKILIFHVAFMYSCCSFIYIGFVSFIYC